LRFLHYLLSVFRIKEEKTMKIHQDLNVWKNSTQLAIEIYNLTKKFPREEIFGVTAQIRRAAFSVPSNISEGAARDSRTEFIRFLNIANGSLSELETQLYITKEIGFYDSVIYEKNCNRINQIRAQITGLKNYLRRKT
jgi:four helix bundle protein